LSGRKLRAAVKAPGFLRFEREEIERVVERRANRASVDERRLEVLYAAIDIHKHVFQR
jgi:hypothetical protein